MTLSDSIADFITRIRNASKAQHKFVDVRWSKIKQNIAEILKEEGFVDHYLVKQEGGMGTMRLYLKYSQKRMSVLGGLRRISKPGLRRYVGYQDIPVIYGGMGVVIMSTSKGVITGASAKRQKLGGELLCYVW